MKYAILLLSCSFLLPAQTAASIAHPVGLAPSRDRLIKVDKLLKRYTDEGNIAGAVALVLRDGKPVYAHAVGMADKELGRKMTVDTIFRIASQTKAITSTAVLMLFEDGGQAHAGGVPDSPRSRQLGLPPPEAVREILRALDEKVWRACA